MTKKLILGAIKKLLIEFKRTRPGFAFFLYAPWRWYLVLFIVVISICLWMASHSVMLSFWLLGIFFGMVFFHMMIRAIWVFCWPVIDSLIDWSQLRDAFSTPIEDKQVNQPENPFKPMAMVFFIMLTLVITIFIGIDQSVLHRYHPLSENASYKVVTYTSRWCLECKRLHQCLMKSGIAFEDRDIEQAEHRKAYYALRAGTLPVILIGQEVVYGFDKKHLQKSFSNRANKFSC